MRNLISLSVKALAAGLAVVAFSSCDPDLNQSMILSGEWEGDFGMYYDYNNGEETIRFDSYDTKLAFYPEYDYATHGYGKEVDYYEYGPYEYQYYSFDWEIRDGVLYMDYPHDTNLSTRIYDYRMNNNRFTGYFDDSDMRFSLKKISDYYDWGPYCGDYCYGYRDGWYVDWYFYFGSTRSSDVDNYVEKDSANAKNTVPTEDAITRGNRFAEK